MHLTGYKIRHLVSRQVYSAREKETGDVVALKKVRMDNEKEGVSGAQQHRPGVRFGAVSFVKSIYMKDLARLRKSFNEAPPHELCTMHMSISSIAGVCKLAFGVS